MSSCLLVVLIAGFLVIPPRPTAALPRSSEVSVSKSELRSSAKEFTNSWGLSPAAADELVRYPNAAVAFICGPQLRAGTRLNPFPWFDTVAHDRGKKIGETLPRIAPFGPMSVNTHTKQWQNVISGRVSVTKGSAVVTGKGTRFTRDVDPLGPKPAYAGHLRIRDASGTEQPLKVRSVESDTHLTLNAPWPFAPVRDAVADTFYDDHGAYGANTDHYYLANYYDTALVQYINYYRTGDARFLESARKTADAWWHSQWIADGTVTEGVNHLPPRSMAFAGLMLRALDGRPEMWDYLEREVRANFDNWVYRRKTNPSLYYDIREDGYAQLYAVMLAKVLPDIYPLHGNGTLKDRTGIATDGAVKRATYLSQTEDTAVNFFGRLQRPDGSWRWNADGSSNPAEQHHDIEQPFMVGLYLESVVLLHQLTKNARVKANLLQQLTRATRHLYNDAFERNPVTDLPPHRWRSMVYFWGGGTTENPKKYSPPAPSTVANKDPGQVRAARHLNSTIHHAFGYAYFVTRDETFKRMGDDVFEASYGDQEDGFHCLADSGKAKDYDMNYRASGRYLVWRLSHSRSAATAHQPVRSVTVTGASKFATQLPASTNLSQFVSNAFLQAKQLSTDLANREQIETLINQIENARRVLVFEKKQLPDPQAIAAELQAALNHARTALSIAGSESSGYELAKLRVGWSAARLKRANDLIKQTGSRHIITKSNVRSH